MKNLLLNITYSGNRISWIIIKYLLYLLVILTIKHNKGLNFDTIYNTLLTSTLAILIYGSILILINHLINKYIRFSEYVYSNITQNSIDTFKMPQIKRKLYIVSIINLVFSLIILGIIPLIYNLYSIYALNKLTLSDTNLSTANSINTLKQSNNQDLQEIKIESNRILLLLIFLLLLGITIVIIKRHKHFESKKENSHILQDYKYNCMPIHSTNFIGEPNVTSIATISITNSQFITLGVSSNYSKYFIVAGCYFKTQIDTILSCKLQLEKTSLLLNIESTKVAYINGNRTLLVLCTFPEITEEMKYSNINSISLYDGNIIISSGNQNPISISQLYNCVKDEVLKHNPPILAEPNETGEVINSETDNSSKGEFYIVRHSALTNEQSAINLVNTLLSQNINSSYLWIPDYRTLGSNQYYLVYYGPFKSEVECSNFIEAQGDNLTQDNYGELVSNGINRVIIRKGKNIKHLSISE